jgi:hypothetical protein
MRFFLLRGWICSGSDSARSDKPSQGGAPFVVVVMGTLSGPRWGSDQNKHRFTGNSEKFENREEPR